MYSLGIVHRKIVRADAAVVKALSQYGVATVHEAMGRTGLMQPPCMPCTTHVMVEGSDRVITREVTTCACGID
jgi:hypothetical protein